MGLTVENQLCFFRQKYNDHMNIYRRATHQEGGSSWKRHLSKIVVGEGIIDKTYRKNLKPQCIYFGNLNLTQLILF